MHAAERELNIASDAINVMGNETTFTGFERAWTDFLFRLERAWEISKRHAEKSGPAGQKWLSAYANFRKKDSLISYLKHARDAETHAVAPTIDRDLRFSFRDSSGRPFRVDAVDFEIINGTLSIDIKTPDDHLNWRGEVLPGDPKLLRFKTRSTWFNPPHEHLGNSIRNIHPVAGALLGLEFYRSAVGSLLRETALKEPATPLNN